MRKKDYYEVLNLAPSCTAQDVKKNYHKLALKWHPDKHINKSEAEGKFTEINEAYTILGDTKKRELYDTSGHQGLMIDQEMQDFMSCNKRDFFYQKNFQGTNKSAFEVLRDIFEEDDDDDGNLFGAFNPFDATDNFRCNIKSFIDENLMSSENEDGDSFFKKYTPTFMDSSFFGAPLFGSNGPKKECSSHSEFFSFFSSGNSDMQSFSRTSTTISNKGKVKTSTKQRVQKGGKVYENQETFEFIESVLNPTHSIGKNLNCKRPPKFTHERSEVVVIEDDDIECFNNVNISGQNKKKQKNTKFENSNCPKKNKNSCKMFELNDLADDECDIFTGSELKFSNGCCKKNKK